MKKTVAILASLSLLMMGFSGCNQAETQTPTQQDIDYQLEEDNFEVSTLKTHEKLEQNVSIKLIDVRTPEEYNEKHISDSTLVPLDTLSTGIAEVESLSKSDEIIVYCRSGNRSETAYNVLTSLGYTNVKSMAGGINEWTSLGYNVCLGTSLTC